MFTFKGGVFKKTEESVTTFHLELGEEEKFQRFFGVSDIWQTMKPILILIIMFYVYTNEYF